MKTVNWFGTDPHTRMVHLGSLGSFISGSGFPLEHQGVEDGEYPFLKVGSLSRAGSDGVVRDARNTVSEEVASNLGARVIPARSILMAKIGEAMRLRRFGVNEVECCIDNNMMAIVPRTDLVNIKYLRMALTLVPIEVLVNPGPVPSLDVQGLRMFSIPLPLLETQQRIADYLDRETAEIDAAVADLDRYVELLRKRQLAAEDAIIWGESVEYVRLKFLIDELDERAGQNRVDWPLLSVSIHNGVQERIEDRSKIQAVSDKLDHYKVVQTGDIVLNRMRAFQGALGISSRAGLTSPDYAVLRSHDESSAMWITLVMKTRKFVSQMAMNIRGIGSVDQGNARTPRINVSQLFDFKIPMPDKILRDQIVEMILRDQDELRRIVAESNHLRDLLLKRRSVLITDVVTGRKQV